MKCLFNLKGEASVSPLSYDTILVIWKLMLLESKPFYYSVVLLRQIIS